MGNYFGYYENDIPDASNETLKARNALLIDIRLYKRPSDMNYNEILNMKYPSRRARRRRRRRVRFKSY